MRTALVFALGMFLAACGGGGGSSQATTTPRPVRGSSDVITEAEINAGVYQNALEIVQNLRPNMMRPRAGAGAQPVRLYLDDVRMNDLTGLATVPAGRVKEIRFINARDATTRWGTDHDSGVILVTTKR